jgi:hypothetical protein
MKLKSETTLERDPLLAAGFDVEIMVKAHYFITID